MSVLIPIKQTQISGAGADGGLGNDVILMGTDVNFKLLDRATFTSQTTPLSSVLGRLVKVEDESATNSDSIESLTDRVAAIEQEMFSSLVRSKS